MSDNFYNYDSINSDKTNGNVYDYSSKGYETSRIKEHNNFNVSEQDETNDLTEKLKNLLGDHDEKNKTENKKPYGIEIGLDYLRFTIESCDPYGTGRNVYRSKTSEFKPGVNVLVGCNGSGKTTIIKCLQDILRYNNFKYRSYDNLRSGSSNSVSRAFFYGDMEFGVSMLSSSEGEGIVINLGKYFQTIVKFANEYKNKVCPPIVFLDAIDSGMSIDNIDDLSYVLNDICQKNPRLYIIISANSYELTRGNRCWDVKGSREITFKSYEEYKKFIIKTKKSIEKQYEKLSNKE